MPTRNPDRRPDDERVDSDDATRNAPRPDEHDQEPIAPNPPRTTKGPLTAPKFGSAGSGGAELEPGPERN